MFLITGCELVVDFDIPVDKPMLVVNALVNPDSTWRVSVSKSRHILDEFPAQAIGNAIVTITDEQDNPITTLLSDGLGYYRSDQKPLAGVQYKLKAETAGYDAVFARANIPQTIPITEVKVDTILRDGYQELVAKITFVDPPEKNYYQVYTSVKMIVQRWTPNEIITDTLTQFFPLYLAQSDLEESSSVFSDLKFNATEAKISVRLSNWMSGVATEQHIILLHLSEAYYNYELTRSLQQRAQGDPFAQPVQVFNNITNGVGIFAGCAGYAYELQ